MKWRRGEAKNVEKSSEESHMQSNTEERGREGFLRFCAVRERESERGMSMWVGGD
jgi:hypothetical protein